MNPLEKHPYLFANGKFKVKHGETVFKPEEWGIDGGELCKFDDWGDKADVTYPMIAQCTLIARPISDMTDEELLGIVYIDEVKDRKYCIRLVERYNKSFNDALYLLSIGVYPFDQSHFDNGTVIDINKS